MASYYMKFIGNSVESPTTGSPVSIELKILGILYRPKNLADIVTFFGGAKRREYVEEISFDIEFEPFSTVDDEAQHTNQIVQLKNICSMGFLYLAKPTSPNELPPRWRHTTGFPLLDYFETPQIVVLDGDIEPSKNWGSAQESLSVTFTKAD